MQAQTVATSFDDYSPQEVDTFALIACAKTKHPGRLPAREKYAGQLFPKARDYAEAVADGYAILSGKYGALAPGTVIEDYDVAVTDRDPDAWAADVLDDLDAAPIDACSTLIVLAGRHYRQPLADWLDELEAAGVDVQIPLDGLGIGEQLQELNRRLDVVDAPQSTTEEPNPYTSDVLQREEAAMEEFDEELHELRTRQLSERTKLSGRQAEVVAAKMQGLSHAEIAEELGMKKGVVDKHSTRARDKVTEARALLEAIGDVYPAEDVE